MLKRLTRGSTADAGFGLIEVIVAILVLAIVSTGVVASMSTILQMSSDNRSRITAANLATQDLDLVRAIADPYQVANKVSYSSPDNTPLHPQPNATVFTVTRTVSWVSATGADVSCNSSTNLFYLRVNVRVTWSGMLSTTKPVQDDTVLAPSDASSNAETGAISIAVAAADGSPVGGVSVTITPNAGGGGAALSTQPKPTTADGCTYANQITPGTYTVTISKSGYVDPSQATSPKQTSVTVAAGTTQPATFTYDRIATYRTTYTSGPVGAGSGARLPSNLPTNFISGGTSYTTNTPAASKQLYPYPAGYSATTGFAGDTTTGCASVDPASWVGGLSGTTSMRDGVRSSANPAAAPGGTATLSIATGVVSVRTAAGATLTATEATPQGAGNPGCAVTGKVLTWASAAPGGWVDLALPYGSWTVLANGVAVSASDLQILTNAVAGGVATDGTVTLDPRKALP